MFGETNFKIKVGTDAVKLVIGHGLGPASNLILAFILSQTAEKENYATYMTILSIIMVLYGFNGKSAIQRKINIDYNLTLNIQNWLNISWLPILLIFYLIYGFDHIILFAISTWIYCSTELTLERLRYNLQLNRYLLYRVTKVLIDLISFYVLINLFQINIINARSTSLLISSVIIFLLSTNFKKPSSEISMSKVKEHLKLGLGMLMYSFSMIMFTMSDRLILDYYDKNEYYTYFLMSTCASVQMMIGASLGPIFMNNIIHDKSNKLFERYLISIHVISTIGIFCVLSCLIRFRIVSVESEWQLYFVVLSIAATIQSIYITRVQELIGKSEFYQLFKIAGTAASLLIFLNLSLVPYFGTASSAFTMMLCSMFLIWFLQRINANVD